MARPRQRSRQRGRLHRDVNRLDVPKGDPIFVAVQQIARLTFEPNLALFEEDRPVGDRQRDVERLLDDQHRLALFLQPLDRLEKTLDDATLVNGEDGKKRIAAQRVDVPATATTTVNVEILSVYEGTKPAVAVAEVEFFTKP